MNGPDWVGGAICVAILALIGLTIYVASLRSDREVAERALNEARDLVHGLGVLDPTLLAVFGASPRWHPFAPEWQHDAEYVFDVAQVRRLAETQSTTSARTIRDDELAVALTRLAEARTETA